MYSASTEMGRQPVTQVQVVVARRYCLDFEDGTGSEKHAYSIKIRYLSWDEDHVNHIQTALMTWCTLVGSNLITGITDMPNSLLYRQ